LRENFTLSRKILLHCPPIYSLIKTAIQNRDSIAMNVNKPNRISYRYSPWKLQRPTIVRLFQVIRHAMERTIKGNERSSIAIGHPYRNAIFRQQITKTWTFAISTNHANRRRRISGEYTAPKYYAILDTN